MKMNSGNYTWISTISVDNERIYLGSYQSEKSCGSIQSSSY